MLKVMQRKMSCIYLFRNVLSIITYGYITSNNILLLNHFSYVEVSICCIGSVNISKWFVIAFHNITINAKRKYRKRY